MSKLCKICKKQNGNPLNPTCSHECYAKYKQKRGVGIRKVSKTNKNTPAKFSTQTKAIIQERDMFCI